MRCWRAVLPLLASPALAQPPPSRVFMVGIPAGEPGSHLMGEFTLRSPPLVNGRPSFSRGDAEAIWFAEGAWCVGRVERLGQRTGVMVSTDPRPTPDGISRWAVHLGPKGGAMQLSPAVRCLAGEEGAAAAAAEARELEAQLARLPRTVYIVASKMSRIRREFAGAYHVPRGGALVNRRLVYLREGSVLGGKRVSNNTRMIWQERRAGGAWFVGTARYAGRPMGGVLVVHDPAIGPDKVEGEWKIVGVAAPGATPKSTAAAAAAAAAGQSTQASGARASPKLVAAWQPAPDVRVMSGKAGKTALDRFKVEESIFVSRGAQHSYASNGRRAEGWGRRTAMKRSQGGPSR
ncbi:hypothetical protein AB1Y20_002092 [Prymnesium parvum]|uniref:Uncharacterized protein n=1 Tax=Prymnesium parvum TaxID=97485 RepID=A0AB34J6Z2_PRYPA